jgi:hypothetical protein
VDEPSTDPKTTVEKFFVVLKIIKRETVGGLGCSRYDYKIILAT